MHDEARGRPVVAIFRQNLFRVSEPFVTDPAERLRRYEPLYLGRQRFGPAPPGAAAQSRTLADAGRWRAAAPIAWHMATRASGPYRRLLGSTRPALIHAHFGIDGVQALPLARRLGVPLVTTFHGFDATLGTAALLSSPAWFHYPLNRRSLARDGALFLCVSDFIRTRVLALGFPPARTVVHHTGVDCAAIRPGPALDGNTDEPPTILHVGRLVEMKGTTFLLRAFAGLDARHGRVRLAIIGDGPLRRSLEREAGALGLGARVRFLGAQPHAAVLDAIGRATALVLPSRVTGTGRVEGLGMVLLEAAASGVPVVATTVGGIPEAVDHGDTGLLVPPCDVAALRDALGSLLDDPDRRRRMGRAARAMVSRRFDLAVQAAALEDRYDRVRAQAPIA